MALVLSLLCAFFSWATFDEQHPGGLAGGQQLASEIVARFGPDTSVLVVARDISEDSLFADTVNQHLTATGFHVLAVVKGEPADARQALQEIVDNGQSLDVVAANNVTAGWSVYDKWEELESVAIVTPASYRWPDFLKVDNLRNITDQIAVIAIIAIGMTMVIITAGIDLSVGSLIALSAVVAAWSIQYLAGAEQASTGGMIMAGGGAIAICAAVGLFSGTMIIAFGMPPFIVTLAMMLVASGLAYLIAAGESIYQLPDSFTWLGRGTTLRIPNAVLLMIALYAAAHVMMTRTTLGRYIYAVGGNAEAARLSGVRVKRILLIIYTISGGLAGLGGVVMASQLKSGSPTYGQMYELYVIAAVVVGGTSLAGGEGRILGTLIGAFIIAVIQNGMNLTNVESYTQKVVLGLVILGAVLLDTFKRQRLRVA